MKLNFRKKILKAVDYLQPLDLSYTVPAHYKILNKINDLTKIIPSKYSQFDLAYTIRPKASGYYTSLDKKYLQFVQAQLLLRRLIKSKRLSQKISYSIHLMMRKEYNRRMVKQSIGDPGDFIIRELKKNYSDLHSSGRYNILFTNTPSYLRVLALYVNNSNLDNLLLVIPHSISKLSILESFPKNKLIYFDDFISKNIESEYIDCLKEMNEVFINNQTMLDEIFTIDNYKFYQFIKAGIEKLITIVIPKSIMLYQTINELNDQIKIKSFIGGRVRKIFDRSFYKFAINNNIPAYVLLHADIGSDIKEIDDMGHFEDISGVFVWGKSQEKIIRRDKFSNVKNIFVVGSPLFDINSKLSKRSNSDNSNPKILYACGKNDHIEINSLIECLNSLFDKFNLLLKVHPGQKDSEYDNFNNIDNIEVIGAKKILEDLINQCDIFITTTSSSIFQAIARDKPIIMINYDDLWTDMFTSYFEFNKSELRQFVTSSTIELKAIIDRLLSNKHYTCEHIKNQKRYLKRKIKLYNEINGASHAIDKILSS